MRRTGRIKFTHTYEYIISCENLLEAWREFVRGKRSRRDVQEFQLNLMGNILALHRELMTKTYQHSPYHAFRISDPKPRQIHKATVRDRLLHHAVYRALYPYFDRMFMGDSFSCRDNKGTNKALDRFRLFAYQVSRNHTRTAWVLQCDIRKFFSSIDQLILMNILRRYIVDANVLWVLSKIVGSFHSATLGTGLPLGNLTSQLLVNVYMNEFDQYVKHMLKARHYIRYADDFVVLSADKKWLEDLLPIIHYFLLYRLYLDLHPRKVSIVTIASGVDYLGWVHFSDHRVLRTSTKRRMFRRINASRENVQVLQSYMGLLSHGNTQKLRCISFRL